MKYSLYYASTQHSICNRFSKEFYNDLLSNVTLQIDSGTNWYDFLSLDTEIGRQTFGSNYSDIVCPLGESALSKDDMVKEIIEHKQKLLNMKPFITLSNAVATTLADASIAQKVNLYNPSETIAKANAGEPDSVVFSCNHNLPRYYMLETVVPEFLSRMGELPEALPRTGEVLSKYYQQAGINIPMACPYCVYNNLRTEQLQVYRESGLEMTNHKSAVWEI